MTAGMFCFAVMNCFISYLAGSMHSMFLVFMRNLFAICLMIPWVLQHGTGALRTTRMRQHFWRAGVGIIAMELWFWSLSILPVGQATALSFTTPIFVTVCAILLFGERAGIRRWSAILIGFAGVLVIIRPGFGIPVSGAAIVLASSAMMAIASLLVKTLSKTEEPGVIVFYMSLFMTVFSLPPAIPHFEPLNWIEIGGVFSIALFSTLAHFCLVRAYRLADMVVLMPFDFTRLVFTAGLAYVAFGEMLDSWTVIGAAVIVSSSVYIAYRETRHKSSPALPISSA